MGCGNRRRKFRGEHRPGQKGIVSGDGIFMAGVAMVHIDANHFAEEQLHVLGIAVGVAMRTGIAHGKIKKAIRTELNAAAAVIAGEAGDGDEAAGRFAGIMEKIGEPSFFDDDGGDGVALEELVFEVVFSVVAELWMEGKTEEAIGTGFAVSLRNLIEEERFFFAAGGFLDEPDVTDLVSDEPCVGLARDLGRAGEAGFDIIDSWSGEFLIEKWSDFDGSGELRNFGRSGGVTDGGGFRLAKRN